MIRTAGRQTDGTPLVMLGLEPVNMTRLREGQPIRVNLRQLDPNGPPIEDLPDLDVIIFFAGTQERAALTKLIERAVSGEDVGHGDVEDIAGGDHGG